LSIQIEFICHRIDDTPREMVGERCLNRDIQPYCSPFVPNRPEIVAHWRTETALDRSQRGSLAITVDAADDFSDIRTEILPRILLTWLNIQQYY
jgi:hypothetical protein